MGHPHKVLVQGLRDHLKGLIFLLTDPLKELLFLVQQGNKHDLVDKVLDVQGEEAEIDRRGRNMY
jgi:hypothetical protein